VGDAAAATSAVYGHPVRLEPMTDAAPPVRLWEQAEPPSLGRGLPPMPLP
jgi:hypothetical protein